MKHFFYDSIHHLRSQEKIIIYDNLVNIDTYEENLVQDYLKIEWETESLNYPYNSPIFDKNAALWAAKLVYTSCQILFDRQHNNEDLINILPQYVEKPSPENILSIDLTLRFLPDILEETKNIDPDDPLINILEDILNKWHYSGIGSGIKCNEEDLDVIFENPCLEQLYIDRVIEKKDNIRANSPVIKEKIKATMGNYSEVYWKELKKD